MLIDNETGRALPEKSPVHLLLEEGVIRGSFAGLGTDYCSNPFQWRPASYRRYAEVYGFFILWERLMLYI